jgi:hypothetical protein
LGRKYKKRAGKENLEKAEELYPNGPEVPIPLTLSLKAYTGQYSHAGYGALVAEYKDEKIQVECNRLKLEVHVITWARFRRIIHWRDVWYGYA